MVTRVMEAVKAVALCHNVTPVYESTEGESQETEADMQSHQQVIYQASSPDEVLSSPARKHPKLSLPFVVLFGGVQHAQHSMTFHSASFS